MKDFPVSCGSKFISRRSFIAGSVPLVLGGCSAGDFVQAATSAITSGSLSGAARSVATSKAIGWAANPKSLARDFENFEEFAQNFMGEVGAEWGNAQAQRPGKKIFVKYSDSYKSRGVIDFSRGIVRVETLEPGHLKQAVVTTLLSPEDPQSVDLFSDRPVKLGGRPFLYNQVLDRDRKAMRWPWRAERFADYLIKYNLQSRQIALNDGRVKTETFVEFPLVMDHSTRRETRYRLLVDRYAAKYRLERSLVYAIIQTESNFNPYAVSWVPAYGLMQIVPTTAGRDAYQVIHGKKGTPSREYLFNVENNISMGTAYLHILQTRYLAKVHNPLSREYCTIAGYNGGAGNVLKSFSSSRSQAFSRINQSSPRRVYEILRAKMPKESQHYLAKVTQAKRTYA